MMACLGMHLSMDLKRLWELARASLQAEGPVKAWLEPVVCFNIKVCALTEGHSDPKDVGEIQVSGGLCHMEGSGCCFGNILLMSSADTEKRVYWVCVCVQ